MKNCAPLMLVGCVLGLAVALYLVPSGGGLALGGGTLALLMLLCCVGPMLYMFITGSKGSCCRGPEKTTDSPVGSGDAKQGDVAEKKQSCH